ncbi:TERF1-interacting nuclear factor 2 isoform X2 [Pyxicephalus adspersus]
MVMQKRDFKNFEKIVEFLELTHEQAPGLLCYRHHAKLSAGLRGKIVLNMIEDNRSLSDILEALNAHFPPVCPDDSTTLPREAAKVQQSKIHFRKLVLRLIDDEEFRQNYLETTLQAEYGEMFLMALEKLLWEFLYRLQIVLNQEVPKTAEQSYPDREELVHTPVFPISQSNSDNSVTVMQQDRSYLFHMDTSSEEPHASLQTSGKKHQNGQEMEPDSASHEDGYDSDQTIIESEGSQEMNYTRIPSAPMFSPDCNSRASNQSIDVEKSRTPFFDIFGFDCSESSNKNNVELSPPNPLQSQDSGHNICLDLGGGHIRAKNKTRMPLVKKNGRGGTKVVPPKSHTLPAPVSEITNKEHSGTGGHLPQGLMSWRFQPKVYLKPLPLDLLSKYNRPQPDCMESDSATPAVYPELTQSSGGTYSWLVDSYDPPDDYSKDPDYYPGCDI